MTSGYGWIILAMLAALCGYMAFCIYKDKE